MDIFRRYRFLWFTFFLSFSLFIYCMLPLYGIGSSQPIPFLYSESSISILQLSELIRAPSNSTYTYANASKTDSYTKPAWDWFGPNATSFLTKSTDQTKNPSSTEKPVPYTSNQSEKMLNEFRMKYPNCTREWVESLYKRKWVYGLFPDTVVNNTLRFVPEPELESYVSTICNISHLLNSPIKIWRADGGGPETDPKYENYNAGMLDDPNCVLEMGHSSRPISDEEFMKSKFVAIYYFAEQTSKAIRHLASAFSFAKKFNRILIIPRVGSKTRAATVSMGGYLPLCTYFNITRDVDWMTYEHYYSTAMRLNFIPNVGFKCHRKLHGEDKCVFDYELDVSPLRLIPLLALTRGQYPNASNTITYSCFPLDNCRLNGTLVKNYEEEKRFDASKNFLVLAKSVWVINVYHFNLRIPPVNYSSKVIEQANSISRDMKSYGSIHLRLEHLCYPWYQRLHGLPSVKKRFMVCVESLVSSVKSYIESSNSAGLRLYMASDISDISVQSTSWLPEYVGAGIEAFNYTKKNLNFVMFENIVSNYANLDGGIHGIIDKMVCVKSKVFFTGSRYCGGNQNFDKEILILRKENGMKKDSTIQWGNIFGKGIIKSIFFNKSAKIDYFLVKTGIA